MTSTHLPIDQQRHVPITPAPGSRRGRLRTALGPSAYAALALPLGAVAAGASMLGRSGRVDRWRRWSAQRFLGVTVAASCSRSRGHALRHALLSLPVDLVAFAIVVPIWTVFVARGVLYPVFGADNLEHSWGGPSLAGAWVAHFVQGPPLLLLVALLLRPVTRIQARLAGRDAQGAP